MLSAYHFVLKVLKAIVSKKNVKLKSSAPFHPIQGAQTYHQDGVLPRAQLSCQGQGMCSYGDRLAYFRSRWIDGKFIGVKILWHAGERHALTRVRRIDVNMHGMPRQHMRTKDEVLVRFGDTHKEVIHITVNKS